MQSKKIRFFVIKNSWKKHRSKNGFILLVFIIIYNIKKGPNMLILWSAYLCYMHANDNNTDCKTLHVLCKLHLHWFRYKLLCAFDYVQISKAINSKVYSKETAGQQEELLNFYTYDNLKL